MTWPTHSLGVVAWLVAAAWIWKWIESSFGLSRVPDLRLPEHDLWPAGNPRLTVIVPARNEETDISKCLLSLIAQDYPNLHVIAVDDRSTDATAQRMAELTVLPGSRLELLQIAELPERWLGKTHAMHRAAELAIERFAPEYLLFTDADVVFSPDALRRALAYAVASDADHFVLAPTALVRRWDEGMLLGVFQVIGLWAVRSWKVADAKALRDAVGVGAFNMLRTRAYTAVGGFESLRMQVVEDVGLGRRVKRLGLKQRIAFGKGLVNVHWAAGASGLVGVLTKNIFAAVHFRILLLLGGCAWISLFYIGPAIALLSRATVLPGMLALLAVWQIYRLIGRRSGIGQGYVFLLPFGAVLLIYALLRSMVTTLWQGGVRWRGTFYSLTELRKNSEPL